MFLRSFVAAALLTALVVAPPAGGASEEHAALNAATFADATGDSGAAPDITDVEVGNNVVTGPIVVWITVPNRPDGLAGEDALFVFVDADRNAATGDELGSEFVIVIDAEGLGMVRWDGVDYVDVEASSLTAARAGTSFRISIHPSDLGGLSAFDFFVVTLSGEDGDAAPNGPPSWPYTFSSGRPPLEVLEFVLSPKAPVAGKALIATMAVWRGDTLEVLTEGKATCTLTVGGKPLRTVRITSAQGIQFCRWNLPKTAKGKAYKGSIAVTYGGSTVKKSFNGRVK